MIAVAVLSALVLGALGAAVGSALGWATAPALPRDAELGRIAGVAVDGTTRGDVQRHSQVFGLRPEAIVAAAAPADLSADAARSRLAADGWRVGPVTVTPGMGTKDTGETYRVEAHTFVATRDGIELLVFISPTPGWPPSAMVMVQQAEPWPALPLTLAGLVAGLLAGWLLAARLGYRVRRLSPWRQMPPVIAATVAMVALGLSGLLTYQAIGRMLLDAIGADPMNPDRFRSFPPFAVYHYDTALDPLPLTGLGALVLLVVLAYALGDEPGSPDEPEGLPYAA